MRLKRRVLLIAALTSLVLGVCLTAALVAGVARLWPVVRSWTESALGGRDAPLSSRVAQLTARLQELRRSGLDGAALAALAGEPGLQQLLKMTETVPALAPLLQDGAYQKAVQEALRQNVPQIAAVNLAQVVSPEVRDAVTRVQQALKAAPVGGQEAGTANQAVLHLLGTEAFAQLSRDPNFFRLLGSPGDTTEAKE